MLRILQVSTADNAGGAEKVAWNLFQEYRRMGHHSWLAVGYKRSDDPNVFAIRNNDCTGYWGKMCSALGDAFSPLAGKVRGAGRLRSLFHRIGEPQKLVNWWKGREEFNFPGSWKLLEMLPERPDVVHCHNLHGAWIPNDGYFDLRAIPWLSQRVPLVMTLHDTWLLSGHCAYSIECERWETGCGSCPDLKIYPPIRRDATAYNWQRKRQIYAESRIYLATPSQWLMQKVERSMLAPAIAESRVIPNGVDLSVFHPADKQAVRAVLGIPPDVKMLLFTATSIRRHVYKDFGTIRAAVALVGDRLHGQHVLFVALGEDGPTQRFGQVEVRFVPFQKDAEAVARYYQAADVYVHAARADTFPNTVLEALACGTPVVATAVGGIPEQIEDGKTGFLVPPGDADAMSVRIEQILKDRQLQQRLALNAAADAVRRFGLEQHVERYLSWYHEILGKWPHHSAARVSTLLHPNVQ